jgi:hypothetical protein
MGWQFRMQCTFSPMLSYGLADSGAHSLMLIMPVLHPTVDRRLKAFNSAYEV